MKLPKFSIDEVLLGFLSNIPLGLFPALASLVLWPLGGSFWKPIRRFGVPGVALLEATLGHGFRLQDLIAAGYGVAVLHLGDGFPDHRPTTQDAGSWLGRQVERVLPDPEVGGRVTKALIILFYWLTLFFYSR